MGPDIGSHICVKIFVSNIDLNVSVKKVFLDDINIQVGGFGVKVITFHILGSSPLIS